MYKNVIVLGANSHEALKNLMGADLDVSQVKRYRTAIGTGFAGYTYSSSTAFEGAEDEPVEFTFHFISDSERFANMWQKQTQHADAFIRTSELVGWQEEAIKEVSKPIYSLQDFESAETL